MKPVRIVSIGLIIIFLIVILCFRVYRSVPSGSLIRSYNSPATGDAMINSSPDPSDIILKNNNAKASAYEKEGMHDEAEGVYRQMLEQHPNNPDIYVNLAAIQIIKGDYEEAVLLCEKALVLEYANATAHNNLAVAYYTLGRFDRAIEQCDLAVKFGYKVKPELLKLLAPYREEEY